METPIYKNFLFDTLLPRVEWFAWLLATVGITLTYFAFPNAAYFLFLGFSTLAAVYFLRSFAPSTKKTPLPYKPNYKPLGKAEEKFFLVHAVAPFIQGPTMAIILIGIQFKLRLLPNHSILLLAGLSILAVVLATQLYTGNLSRKALLVAVLGAVVAYIPSDELVQQFYRHDPVLVEKMLYHFHHPRDRAAAAEVRQLQRTLREQ